MQSTRILGAFVASKHGPAEISPWVFRQISRSYPERNIALFTNSQWGSIVVAAPHICGRDVDIDQKVVVAFTGYLFSTADGTLATRPAEKLLDAYLSEGVACFAKLAGNFSAAIYDGRLPKLLLVRDIAGTKPLYYACGDNFVFGSSAAAVLRTSGLPAIIHEDTLHRYLVHGVCEGNRATLFTGVRSIQGSHYVELAPGSDPKPIPTRNVNRGEIEPIRWRIDDAANELRTCVLASVKAAAGDHATATGVALSGGIDSCGILACLRHALGKDAEISAYSFIEQRNALPPPFDERPWMVASAISANAKHHMVDLDACAVPGAVSESSHALDFPVGSPVALAHLAMFRAAAAQGTSVILNGHGPDAILGGSLHHVFARAFQQSVRCRFLTAVKMLRGVREYAGSGIFRLLTRGVWTTFRLPQQLAAITQPQVPGLRKSWFRDRAVDENGNSTFRADDPFLQVTLKQLYDEALPTALGIEEASGAATGVDSRAPYLASSVIAFAERMPQELMVSDQGETKRLLRIALRGWAPSKVLEQRLRTGFPVPAIDWLLELSPWVEEQFRELRTLPFFDGIASAELLAMLGRRDKMAWRAAFMIWRWILLLHWVKSHDVKFR